MEKRDYEQEIMNNIERYSLLFGAFGILIGVENGKLCFFDLKFSKKFESEDTASKYEIFGDAKYISFKYDEEIKGIVICVNDVIRDGGLNFKQILEIREFDKHDIIVINSIVNGTEYAFNNTQCSLCEAFGGIKDYFYFEEKLTLEPRKEELNGIFSAIEENGKGILEYIKKSCPNISPYITEIMKVEKESPHKK